MTNVTPSISQASTDLSCQLSTSISRDDDIKALKYYHGLLPREDMREMLLKEGDYLLRYSDVDMKKDGIFHKQYIISVMAERMENEKSGDGGGRRKTVVASRGSGIDKNDNKEKREATKEEGSREKEQEKPREQAGGDGEKKEEKKEKQKDLTIRHLVVQMVQDQLLIEKDVKFPTMQELVEYYAKEPRQVNRFTCHLRYPQVRRKWEFLHSDVTVGKKLGEGEFGEVRGGKLSVDDGKKQFVVPTAIKMTKGTSDLTKDKIKTMMGEARIMRNLRHPNIVRMFGVAVDDQPIMILLEYVPSGALDSYLRKNNVSMKDKLDMIKGACQGIKYLHGLRPPIVHRDLAARNCLYDNRKNRAKISDFGLSVRTECYKMDQRARLPIRWCAPECIEHHEFTPKSDVYAFGVVIWELMIDCAVQPHKDVKIAEVKRMIVRGVRNPLKFPPFTPRKLVRFVQKRMWTHKRDQRGVITEVETFVNTLIRSREERERGVEMSVSEDSEASTPEEDDSEDEKKRKKKDALETTGKKRSTTAKLRGDKKKRDTQTKDG